MKKESNQRLESLDILRGFDLFCLVILAPFLWSLYAAVDSDLFSSFVRSCFVHEAWEGFSPWDMVMPLFMFMSGITIPFALSKYRQNKTADKWSVYKRIFKRFILLWILGMICQGGLLSLNIDTIYLFTNTLQAIAVGYLVSAILFINCSLRTQIIFAIVSLLVYWGLMEFVSIGGYGGGDYSQTGNLAEWVDRTVLGRFRDGAHMGSDGVVFYEGYYYTWILSSINFVVMVLSGSFAGQILKAKNSAQKKSVLLLSIGAALILTGNIVGIWIPINKPIFSSSMTLLASGYSFILMAVFYYVVDVRGCGKYLNWLKIFGMNSILAYVLSCVVNFSCIVTQIFGGTEQYLGEFYSAFIAVGNLTILFIILYILYKKKLFLRV